MHHLLNKNVLPLTNEKVFESCANVGDNEAYEIKDKVYAGNKVWDIKLIFAASEKSNELFFFEWFSSRHIFQFF